MVMRDLKKYPVPDPLDRVPELELDQPDKERAVMERGCWLLQGMVL
jgi:hypothetical protein